MTVEHFSTLCEDVEMSNNITDEPIYEYRETDNGIFIYSMIDNQD